MKRFFKIGGKLRGVGGRSVFWCFALGMPLMAATVLGEETFRKPVNTGKEKEAIPLVTSTSNRPDWLTDLSLGVRESYDSNVFLAGAPQQYMPPGTRTLRNLSSWVTTVSAKIGINFAPLFGDQKVIQALTFSYTPDYSNYTDQPSETNWAHRLGTALKGKAGDFSFSLENGFTFIDGSRQGPVYPGNYLSAYGPPAPRERRYQQQDRSKIVLQYDFGRWFVRPVATLLFYNMGTALENPGLPSTPNGYQNFEDRADVNGGVDLGCKIRPDLAVTLGYRYGYQYQQQFSWNDYSSSNNYQRVLFGAEGKLWKWLKVQFQIGPDFRTYAADTPSHITPVNDLNPVVFYGEGNLGAELSRRDTLAFQFKQWRWLSSLGKVPYQDSLYDLTYTRKLSGQLSFTLEGRALDSNYTSALASCGGMRNDWMLTVAPGLRYTFNSHVSADLAYSADWGVNGYDGLPASQLPASKREFFRSLISLGAQVKF